MIELFPTNRNPDYVLEKAKGKYDEMVIIGWDVDGELRVMGGGDQSCADVAWMCEVFLRSLYDGEFDE